jgi:hexosaminidase
MNLIPLPVEMKTRDGKFSLTDKTSIVTDEANLWNAGYLHKLLSIPTGFPLQVQTSGRAQEDFINLSLETGLAGLGAEGYRLSITPDAIVIEAPGTAGIFHGIQTLRQLLPSEVEYRQPVPGVDWSIPCVLIEDQPRFSWRGFMLDEGRHFQGKDTVLLTLDLMAMQKLNVLHWHLSEDQGWRIEITKYPKLTGFGAHRDGTSRSMPGISHDGKPHQGFYTQADIREIVAFASERHIMIVPEIEMPGHSLAALASYPELSCRGGPFRVGTRFGIFADIYCAGKETVFSFLQDVLDEILDLFPSPYIHIGGDEAPKNRWKVCPDCQSRIKSLGLKDEHALQVYFTNRIAAYLASRGRQAMGWNEILQVGLVKGALVQYWAGGRKRLLEAIRTGGRAVVMSDFLNTYLDHSYSLTPLSRAYRYDPIPAELHESEAGSILGLEFPLWSEWVPNRARLDYQVYPRLTAMAETGWTPRDRKNFMDFRTRLERFLERLDILGVRYAPLDQTEPSIIRKIFGIFSIAVPQTRTAGGSGACHPKER